MMSKMFNLTYQKIPNFNEIKNIKEHLENCCENLIVIEEKLDGKTIDGAYACNKIQNYEICIFGEYLETTHLIRYENLPDKKIGFDVNIEGSYLSPKQKIIILALFGIIPAPIFSTLSNYKDFSEDYIRELYLKGRSYFKTELNPKICENFPHLCEYFEQKYGKRNFTEGVVVKCYNNGKLTAIKFVKPEFDEIIKKVGRYENYPQRNKINYDSDFAKKIVKNNLELLNFSENEKRIILKLFENSYPHSFGKTEIEEIIKDNPNLPIIEKIIYRIIRIKQ